MLILFLFFVFANSCYVFERNEYLDCFSTQFDINHDNIITIQEIDTTLAKIHNLANINFNGTIIMQQCDMNNDNVLTETGDWNNSTSCLTMKPFGWDFVALFVCDECKRLGWTGVVQKKIKSL
jgi:hypothetical protein